MSDAAIRASDAERNATIEQLRTAAGEGRLTLEELADRIEAASGPTATRGELARLTADLPAPGPGLPAAGAAVGAGGVAVAPIDASSVFGDLVRGGVWRLPQRSRWKTVFGDVRLDLREAHVPAGAIEIDASSLFGDVELLVPEGVLVDVSSRAVLGDVVQDAGGAAPAGAPRVLLSGGTFFGDVRVQARRRRERLAEWLRGRRR